jgi:sulfopropanediol 3-dehydrogenase
MTIEYLKRATPAQQQIDVATGETVRRMLAEIEAGGEDAAQRFARELDGWHGPVVVDAAGFARAEQQLAPGVKDDIRFARDRVLDFARRQRESLHEFEAELLPGLRAGQKLIPCGTAGCYVPGGRYAHAASAIMSVGTARVAGVRHVVAATPASRDAGVHPASCTRCSCAAPTPCWHSAACRRWPHSPWVSSAGIRPTSSSAPATASSPKPSACCSAAWASTSWPDRPSRR